MVITCHIAIITSAGEVLSPSLSRGGDGGGGGGGGGGDDDDGYHQHQQLPEREGLLSSSPWESNPVTALTIAAYQQVVGLI